MKGSNEQNGVGKGPVVSLRMKNIAPHIYGSSVRIFTPDKSAITSDDLRFIKQQIAGLPKGTAMFGAELEVIAHPSEVRMGDQLLCLDKTAGIITKRIVRITGRVTKGNRNFLETATVFPDYENGFEGFFQEDNVTEVDNENLPCDTLYLRYKDHKNRGEQKQAAVSRAKSFFEVVSGYATDMVILAVCWTMVMCPEEYDENELSADRSIGCWLREFGLRHGEIFRHRLVWTQLEFVTQTATLIGINKIYDDRAQRIDLITPLLAQMQEDILVALGKNPSLVDMVFGEKVGAYWKKRLHAVIEQYYAPKDVILSPFQAKEVREQEQPMTLGMQRRLQIIVDIIERNSTQEGYREAALAAYERIAGQPYPS